MDDRTRRPSSFRKKTVAAANENVPSQSNPDRKACPTCGRDVSIEPGKGPRDWDIDHQPPWSKPDLTGMTRQEVLDE